MVGRHIEYKLHIPHPTAVFLMYLDLFIDKFTSDQVFNLFQSSLTKNMEMPFEDRDNSEKMRFT